MLYFRKKQFVVLGLFCLTMMLVAGCSREKSINLPEQADIDQTQIIDNQSVEQQNFDDFEARSQLYQTWVERMEPYVSENKDGTYSLDWDGFIASADNSSDEDMQVIEELRDGIPVVNEMILSGEFDNMVCGSACWNYWWGRRCCYWGWHAYVAIAAFNLGAAVPGFNIILFGFGQWATYLLDTYGGFCLNGSWIGGYWLTRP